MTGAPYFPFPCLRKSNALSEHMCPTPRLCVVKVRTNCTMSGADLHIGYHSTNGTAKMESTSCRNRAALNWNIPSNSACTSLTCAESRHRRGR